MAGTFKGSCSLPHPLCTCMKCLCTFSFNAPRMSTQRYLDMSSPSVFLLLPTDMVCVVEQVERCPAGVSSVSLFRSLREELLCPRIFFCSDECSNCRQFNFTLFLFTSNAFIYFISLFLLEFHQVVFTMTFKPLSFFLFFFLFLPFPLFFRGGTIYRLKSIYSSALHFICPSTDTSSSTLNHNRRCCEPFVLPATTVTSGEGREWLNSSKCLADRSGDRCRCSSTRLSNVVVWRLPPVHDCKLRQQSVDTVMVVVLN